MESKRSVDRISNLPWDVLTSILVLLPFKEAVSTSILSSKWRDKWTDLSQFVIDDKCFPRFITDKVAKGKMLGKIFHQIQLNHCGPVQKFKLSAYCRPNHSDFNQWISFLVAKGVKEFILNEFDSVTRFKVPSCLLFCSQLNHLELFGCIIKLPDAIHGLNNLATLKLSEVHIDSETLASLILNCPVLEKLTLLRFPDLIVFKIHNPNLKHLNIDSQLRDICLKNSLNLTNVQICMRLPYYFQASEVPHLVRIIGCLKSAKQLVLSGTFLKVIMFFSLFHYLCLLGVI